MAYNSTTGSLHVGDLLNEDDEDTQVDFGYDSIIFRTNRLPRLTIGNSEVSASGNFKISGNTTAGGTNSAEHSIRGILDLPDHNGSNKGLELAGTLITSTAAELNLVDGSSAGTIVPSKAVIYDAQKGITAVSLTGSHLKLGGVTVTSTAAELNLVDGSGAGSAVASKAVIYDAQKGIVAQSVTGSVLSASFNLLTANLTASQGLLVNTDNKAATFGAGSDLGIYHDGSNSKIENTTGHLIINNNATDKHIRLQLGEDNADTAVQVRNNSNSSVWGVDALGQVSGSGTSIAHGDLTTNSNFIQGSGRKYIFEEFIVRFADSTDNTVIVEFGSKIPQYAVVTRVALVVKTASNLSTHVANIRFGTVSGRAADTNISGESLEILGAGASGTRSSDNASGAEDIDLKNDPKEVWINQDLGFMTADVYPYLCNAGTGNGTTNSSAGTVIAYIEWIGLD